MSDIQGTLKANIVAPSGWQLVNGVIKAQPQPTREVTRRPKAVRERHKMIMFLHCAGWKNIEIARQLGYKEQAVSNIIHSQHPELLAIKKQAQATVADNTMDVMLRFRAEAIKSLNTLVIVRDQEEDVGQRRLAARDILDRAGYSVVKKQINLNANIPVDKLEGVMDKLAEAHEVEEMSGQWVVKNPNPEKDKQDAA